MIWIAEASIDVGFVLNDSSKGQGRFRLRVIESASRSITIWHPLPVLPPIVIASKRPCDLINLCLLANFESNHLHVPERTDHILMVVTSVVQWRLVCHV